MNLQIEKEFLTKAIQQPDFFAKWIFYKGGFEDYKCPTHLENWVKLLNDNKFISLMSARKHLKSVSVYCYLLWRIFTNKLNKDLEILYLSYNGDLASYHVTNIKNLLIKNPFFSEIKHKTDAESVLNCFKEGGVGKITIIPSGILSFKRGMHPDIVICDDILADPTNILEPAIIEKINRIFFEDIMSLPKEGGELKLVGTPQHQNDVFSQLKIKKSYAWFSFPAITNEMEKSVLWPEIFSYARLQQIKNEELGEKAFSKEYLCVPVYTAEGYFTREQILSVVDTGLRNINRIEDLSYTIIAGWDIGKHVHPSHFAVFKDDKGIITMIYECFFDNMEYIKQVAIINELVERLRVDKVYLDITRGEMEGFLEQRILDPKIFVPIKFNLKIKNQMASEFEKRVLMKKIKLINTQRMINQILCVTNDLDAIETSEGHGDAFWSIGLACYGFSINRGKGYNIF
jgi:hypothetical protein